MSIAPLRTPGLVLGYVAAARSAVASGLTMPPGSLGDSELTDAVAELASLESQVAAWRLELAGEADRRAVADRTADTDTTGWLTRLTTDPREVVAGGLWLARRLEASYPATRAALAAGDLRLDQARIIVAAGDRAPVGVIPEQLAVAEEVLVAKATGAGNRSGRPLVARRLRIAARRMFETISVPLADAHEAAQLQAESDRAWRESFFSLHDNGDGTWSGRFRLPELHGRLLATALDRLSAPRHVRYARDERSKATLVSDPTLVSTPNGDEARLMAWTELIEHLPGAFTQPGGPGQEATPGFAAGTGIGVLVTIDLDHLRDGLASAGLDTGLRISAGEARRLACNAGVIPAVLGGRSLPLDLGRTRRLHTETQRRALAVVHDSCAIETCDRPFAWTEIHHPQPWSRGGPTDLANALPLCGHHHRRAHDDRFDLRRHDSGQWRFHPRR